MRCGCFCRRGPPAHPNGRSPLYWPVKNHRLGALPSYLLHRWSAQPQQRVPGSRLLLRLGARSLASWWGRCRRCRRDRRWRWPSPAVLSLASWWAAGSLLGFRECAASQIRLVHRRIVQKIDWHAVVIVIIELGDQPHTRHRKDLRATHPRSIHRPDRHECRHRRVHRSGRDHHQKNSTRLRPTHREVIAWKCVNRANRNPN